MLVFCSLISSGLGYHGDLSNFLARNGYGLIVNEMRQLVENPLILEGYSLDAFRGGAMFNPAVMQSLHDRQIMCPAVFINAAYSPSSKFAYFFFFFLI